MLRNHAAPFAGVFLTLMMGSALASTASDCACTCPPAKPAVHHAVARPAPAHVASNADAEYAQSYYNYDSASSASEQMVHIVPLPQPLPPPPQAQWQQAPNDAQIQFGYAQQGPQVLSQVDSDFGGGVGYGAEAGGGGGGSGFEDGYGQVHFYTGGVGQNGPTYDSYGESNPQDGYVQGGYARARFGAWHGYNFTNGPSNGY